MSKRILSGLGCLAVLAATAWFGNSDTATPNAWIQVAPGVLRTPGLPAGYALVEGKRALLIDAPDDASGLRAAGITQVDGVLLTHHHRDSCAAIDQFLAKQVPVRAPRQAATWLHAEPVRKYWQDSLPLRNSRAQYLVVPLGLDGVDCSLQAEQKIEWQGWTIQVISTPGHSPDHVAYAAQRGKDGKQLVFCGDALAAPGKLWSPYTTDWDHWTDAGLKPTAESLRQLAALKPALLLPSHGEPVSQDAVAALNRTADAVAEVGYLKSFERFTKERLGNAPQYRFLAAEQAKSNGKLPWSQVSKSLFLTGNTYVFISKSNDFLVIDPWGQLAADQIAKLKQDRALGALEVVLVSHAHYDHYDGIYALPQRDQYQVWTLDQVATPIAEPYRLRAPFLDARPVKVDRRLRDGETVTWREYPLKFHFFPGQSLFTMAVETTIDGKRCLFTADNFFHQDMFSGSGGWMGLNRSLPGLYAASAKKVLELAPEWVLAEHGGPFEFQAEDFRRRVQWAEASAMAADAISPSGDHRRDWDPHRVRIEPLVQPAKPGATLQAVLAIDNPSAQPEKIRVVLPGRGHFADQTLTLELSARGSIRRPLAIPLSEKITPGRHVFPLQVRVDDGPDGADAFLVVDVQ